MIHDTVELLNNNGFVAWRQQNSGHFNKNIAKTAIFNLFVSLLNSQKHGVQSDLFKPESTILEKEKVLEQIEAALSKAWRSIPDSIRGVADVIGWHRATGKWIACEIKVGNDRLSDEQQAWLANLRKAGGLAFVVRDITLLEDYIEKLGLPVS